MSRYSTTSASLQMRPWPGTTRVPPCWLNRGMVMSMMRFKRIEHALHRAAARDVDARVADVVENTSPAAITSEPRK